MTLHELERKLVELDELRTELKSVIAEVKGGVEDKPKPPHPRWKPMDDNAYYYIYSNVAHSTYWGDNCFDKGTYSVGNVFKTEEAVKFAIERLKVLAEMREWAGKWDDPVILQYNMINCDIVTRYCPHACNGGIRFSNSHDAIECVKAVGEDRIKRYYFMIPKNEDDSN